jgi:hypothetical protein
MRLDSAGTAALLAATAPATGTIVPMRVASTGTAPLPSATTGATTQNAVPTAELPELLPNTPLAATVKSVQPGRAMLDVGGAALAVLTTDDTLQPGAKVVVRFNDAGRGTVDLGDGKTTTVNLGESEVRLPAAPTRQAQPTPAATYTPPAAARQQPVFTAPVVRAEVVEQLPDGKVLVRIDGREVTADAPEPLPVGTRIVVRAEVTPQGVTVRPLPDSPRLPADVAAAVLRDVPNRPPVGPSLQAVMTEVPRLLQAAAGTTTAPPNATSAPVGPSLQAVMSEVPRMLQAAAVTPAGPSPALAALPRLIASLVPRPGEPPTATQLETFVRDGGLMYEAKLARAVRPDRPDPEALREIPRADVKGTLLSAIREAGPAAAGEPVLHQALDSIEAQQALNVLAASTGEGVRLQFPVPDVPQWRTLDVTIQPDSSGGEAEDGSPRRDGYSIFMHTELTEFGETWIDAQVSGSNFRAVLYVENADARKRVKDELGGLSNDLTGLGFAHVLLDVRATSELPAHNRARANAVRGGAPESVSLLDVRA